VNENIVTGIILAAIIFLIGSTLWGASASIATGDIAWGCKRDGFVWIHDRKYECKPVKAQEQ